MTGAPTTLCQDLGPLVDEAWADREAKYRMTTLLLCETVEVVKLYMAGGPADDLTYRVVKQLTQAHLDASCKAPPAGMPFTNITTVRCEANFGYPVGVYFALQWLSLPRLRLLKMYGLTDQEVSGEIKLPDFSQDIRQSRAIKLHFDDCMLGDEGLRHIVAVCSGPISLTVRWRGGLWTERIQWDEIGDMLRQYGARFDHVLIDATPSWPARRSDPDCTFGDLSDTQIRSLAIPYASLVNAISEEKVASSLLPATLERLTLLGADAADQQKLFGNHLRTARPRLTEVRMAPWYRYPYREWFGRVMYQCVDYNVVKDLGLQRAYSG